MEKLKLTDGSISIDSDLFGIGSELLVFIKSYAKGGEGWIITRPEALEFLGKHYNMERTLTDEDVYALSALSGNDYNHNAYGEKTLRTGKLYEYITNPAKVLAEIDKKCNKDHQTDGTKYSTSFLRGLNFFKYASCWSLEKPGGGAVSREDWLNKNFVVSLGYLNPLPLEDGESQDEAFTRLCGFNPKVSLISSWYDKTFTQERLLSCLSLEHWPRTGLPLRPLPFPTQNGIPRPHRSVINFDNIAPENIPFNLLQEWYQSRGHYTGGLTARQLILKVRAFQLYPNTFNDIVTEIPPDINQHILIPPATGYKWLSKNDFLGKVRDCSYIPALTDDYVDSIFGERMNGIRKRGINLVKNMHIDPSHCRATEGLLRGTEKKCIIYNFSCVSSITAKVYAVTIVFDANKKYIEDGSSCKCVDGALFCSHMLCCLGFLGICVYAKEVTYEELIKILPEHVLSLQNMPVPYDHIMSLTKYKYANDDEKE